MITLISKFLIKKGEKTEVEIRREYGVLLGAVGIALNIFLFIIKCVSGIFTGSIAMISDSFNNLSDSGSSLISLIGFKLSGQKPDTEHPYGHGRFEYVSGLIISIIIIVMGTELFFSSCKSIVSKSVITYNIISVVMLIVSIVVKIYMFYYNNACSVKFKSAVMKATARDSLSDCVATGVVLIATLIYKYTGLSLDGYAGVLVSGFIIYTGITSAKDTINPLLGSRPDAEYFKKIYDFVTSYDGVYGVHDLVIHDYGAGRTMVSLHVEVPADGDFVELHDIVDTIERRLQETLGCHAVIHMDPVFVNDEDTNRMKRLSELVVKSIDESLSIHDFRMVTGKMHTTLIFDVVMPFEIGKSEAELKKEIEDKFIALPGNLSAVIVVDRPFI